MRRLARFASLALLLQFISILSALAAECLTNRIHLTREHVDFRIQYRPDAADGFPLKFVLHEGNSGRDLEPDETLLVVRDSAKLEIPAGFEIFGPPGSPLWILPQSQDPQLLYPGFSGEGLPRDVFQGPLSAELVRVEGGGHFFGWQASADGSLVMKFNSRDGIDATDVTRPIVGSHEHLNLAFTQPGITTVVLRASGRRLGETTNVFSAETRFVFAVEPFTLPPCAPPEIRLSQPKLNGATFSVAIEGPAGPYAIESSLDGDVWETLEEWVLAQSGQRVSLNVGNASRRWIRVRWKGI